MWMSVETKREGENNCFLTWIGREHQTKNERKTHREEIGRQKRMEFLHENDKQKRQLDDHITKPKSAFHFTIDD